MRHYIRTFVIIALVVACAMAAVAWYFSGLAASVGHTVEYNLAVKRVDATTVTLQRTHDSSLTGTYAVSWSNGRAGVGDITALDQKTVTRRLTNGPGGLATGMRVHWDENTFAGDPLSSRGLAYDHVEVQSKLGPMPAWFVPGKSSTWVIIVHGHKVTRESTLRVMPSIHDAGYPILSVTYRNDVGAPLSPDGKSHLGASEWNDVDGAITYAQQHGASGVVLFGGSMGGAIVAETARHSAKADLIRGLILDSPVLDWRATLDAQGGTYHLPLIETRLAEQVFTWRTGFDFNDLDQVKHAADFHMPVLLFYGTKDDVVPVEPDKAFVKARPDIVTLVTVEGAGHAAGWNVNPGPYEDHLRSFLNGMPK